MAHGARVDLSKTQLAAAGDRIRSTAARTGVSWLIWPPARVIMQLMGLDDLDVVQAVQTVYVTGAEAWGDAIRYVGVGVDTDDHVLEVKCIDHRELLVIEVFSVSLI